MNRSTVQRRQVLASIGATVAAPWVFTGCRGDDEPTPVVATDEAQLDQGIAPRDQRPALPDDEPIVRVRIGRIRSHTADASTVTIGAADAWIRMVNEPEAESANATLRTERGVLVRAPATIALTASGWTVTDAKGFRPWTSGFETLRFESVDQAADAPLSVNDTPYPGQLRCVVRQRIDAEHTTSEFDLVSSVPMETYLPGVLAQELYPHWPRDTFIAQAVAARSFAMSEIWYWTSRRHYDVTNTTLSQVYRGAVELQRAHDAVESCRGMYLTYDEAIVPGYYSACCGGLAASAPRVIGPNPANNVPPLWGREGDDICHDASVYSWTKRRDRATLARRFARYGSRRGIKPLAALTQIDAIDIAERSERGRPILYRVRGGDVETDVSPYVLKRAIDYSDSTIARDGGRLRSSFLDLSVVDDAVIINGRGVGVGL
ncbi:MAG: SpoIID/LytB domain-containing protein, partial [Planctomycetota bacterium]